MGKKVIGLSSLCSAVFAGNLILSGEDSSIIFDKGTSSETEVKSDFFHEFAAFKQEILDTIDELKANITEIQTVPCTQAELPEPVALWTFDSSSNFQNSDIGGYVGSVRGSVQQVNGAFGKGAWFNNQDGNSFTYSNPVSLTRTSTVSFWANIDPTCSNNQIPILESSNSRIGDLLYPARAYFRGNNVYQDNIGNTCSQDANRWVHYAFVDNGFSIRMYKGGTYVSNHGGTYHSFEGFNINHIGTVAGFGTNGFHGTLDDIGVWSEALTDTQIRTIANGIYSLKDITALTAEDCSTQKSGSKYTPDVLWTFDNTYTSTHSSVSTSSVGSVPFQAGKYGMCAFFDNNHVNRLQVSNFPVLGAQSTTMFWSKIDPTCSNNQIPIIETTNDRMFDLLYEASFVRHGSQRFSNNNNICSSDANQWVHHAFVDTGNEHRVYRNGQAVQPNNGRNYASYSNFNLKHIGSIDGWGTNGYHGCLDDLAFFNTALDQSDILEIISMQKSLAG